MSPRRVVTFLQVSCLALSLVLGNEGAMNKTCSTKPHFVLVHGYGGAAWNWYKIKSLIDASNYKATCLDLKGSGMDPSDPLKVRTFNEYNSPLIKFLADLPDDEKVILVGHSAGGLSVTDASHQFSEKIQVAVYVAATMLKNGYMTDQDLEDGVPGNWNGSILTPTQKSECQINHVISQEDGALASILGRPTVPVEPLLNATFKGDKAEHVPRVYIKTNCDTIVLPEQQDAMIKKWRPSKVFTMNTGHGLISSDPFVLFGLLVKVAASVECNEIAV